MSAFSDRLRELRGSTSQAEMAKCLGMKQPQWARYESGRASPGVDILANICRVHAVSADWLLGLTNQTRSNTAIASAPHSVAIAGNNQSVIAGKSKACDKCPLKKKLQALEKVFNAS